MDDHKALRPHRVSVENAVEGMYHLIGVALGEAPVSLLLDEEDLVALRRAIDETLDDNSGAPVLTIQRGVSVMEVADGEAFITSPNGYEAIALTNEDYHSIRDFCDDMISFNERRNEHHRNI